MRFYDVTSSNDCCLIVYKSCSGRRVPPFGALLPLRSVPLTCSSSRPMDRARLAEHMPFMATAAPRCGAASFVTQLSWSLCHEKGLRSLPSTLRRTISEGRQVPIVIFCGFPRERPTRLHLCCPVGEVRQADCSDLDVDMQFSPNTTGIFTM